MRAVAIIAALSLAGCATQQPQNAEEFRKAAPVAFLILICIAMTVAAGPAMSYLDSAADALETPDVYIRNVLGERAEVVP